MDFKKLLKTSIPAIVIVASGITAGILLSSGNNDVQERSTVNIVSVEANNIHNYSDDMKFEDVQETQVQTEESIVKEKIAMYPEYVFTPAKKTAYFITDSKLKTTPYENGKDGKEYSKYEKIIVSGTNDLIYWEAMVGDEKAYVNSKDITFDESVIENMKQEEAAEKQRLEEEKRQKEEQEKQEEQEEQEQDNSSSYEQHESAGGSWTGSKLTASMGVNSGPQGKETYYNLPMDGVVSIMRSMGFDSSEYPYWERDDGCKMLGPYIMVAANLDVFPRGSTVECSLGTALVCDTGGFAYENPYQLDIATNW